MYLHCFSDLTSVVPFHYDLFDPWGIIPGRCYFDGSINVIQSIIIIYNVIHDTYSCHSNTKFMYFSFLIIFIVDIKIISCVEGGDADITNHILPQLSIIVLPPCCPYTKGSHHTHGHQDYYYESVTYVAVLKIEDSWQKVISSDMYFIANLNTLVTIQPVAVQSNVHPSIPPPQTSLPICRQITTAPLPSYSLQAYLFQTSSQIGWNLVHNFFL